MFTLQSVFSLLEYKRLKGKDSIFFTTESSARDQYPVHKTIKDQYLSTVTERGRHVNKLQLIIIKGNIMFPRKMFNPAEKGMLDLLDTLLAIEEKVEWERIELEQGES